jgi:hypothetical protein
MVAVNGQVASERRQNAINYTESAFDRANDVDLRATLRTKLITFGK